jgi:hypothetical protein
MQPLACDLLQQLPAGIIQLSSLQMQMAQQGEAALQLQQHLLAGYLPLLSSQQPVSSIEPAAEGADFRPVQLDAVPSFRQQPLCHQLFEMQLQQQQGGWQLPNYCVYLHYSVGCHSRESDDEPTATAAAAAATMQQQGVKDDAADSLLQLLPQRCGTR